MADNAGSRLTIVPYESRYQNQIIDLILDIQNNEAGINLSLAEQPDLLDVETFYVKDGGAFWIALDDKHNVVGTIALMKKTKNVGVLKKFFVRADFRSKKVGFKLYQSLMEFCERDGIRVIVLDTPSVAHASHKFYERNGFERIEKEALPIPYEYPDRDSILYMKRL